MKRIFLLLALMCLTGLNTFAQKKAKEPLTEAELLKAQQAYLDSVETAIKYQTGIITLSNNLAKLKIPAGFKYINPEQSNQVLTELWGNPPSEGIYGIILPEKMKITDENAYAFVVEWDEMGYVKDDDADEINYDDLLKDMKEDMESENEERKKEGYPAIQIVGWASKPFYDKNRKILHWAKELKFEGGSENTLNYNIRILGRKGVLVLNAVAGMAEFPLVNKDINKVLDIVEFTDGNKYADFNPSADKIAAVGIGGLVAGKVLAKLGILGVLAKFFAPLLKFGKLLIVAVGAGLSAIWRFFTGKKEEEGEVLKEINPEEPTEPTA